MGAKCKACEHVSCDEINQAIIRQDSYLEIASRFGGLSVSGLARHKANCILGMIMRAETAMPVKAQIDIHAACVRVMQEAGRLGAKAEGKNQLNVAVNALDRYLRAAEFAAKCQEGKEHADYTRDPRWLDAVQHLWTILARYPDADRAVRQEWGQQTGGDSEKA